MTIRHSPQAIDDLLTRLAHVASNDPAAAERFAERIFRVVQGLARRDFDGPVERLRSGLLVRSWTIHPLRLFYRRTTTTLEILRLYRRPDRSLAG